jgi:uncharacterized membrane protein
MLSSSSNTSRPKNTPSETTQWLSKFAQLGQEYTRYFVLTALVLVVGMSFQVNWQRTLDYFMPPTSASNLVLSWVCSLVLLFLVILYMALTDKARQAQLVESSASRQQHKTIKRRTTSSSHHGKSLSQSHRSYLYMPVDGDPV